MSRPDTDRPAAVARAPVDLRLCGPALGAWLAAWWCLAHGPWHAAAVAAGAALTAALTTLTLHPARTAGGGTGRGMGRWGGVALGVVGVALGVGMGAAATAPRLVERDTGALARAVQRPGTVEMQLVVRDDPRPAAARRGGAPLWVITASAEHITLDGAGHATSGRLLVLGEHPGWEGLLPGQRVTVDGGRLLAPQRRDLTAAVLRTTAQPRKIGAPPWLQRAAGSLRTGLQKACAPLPDRPGGLLPGLVVGDTSKLDPAVTDAFQQTGMTHLTAVSGANLAILAGLVLAALRGIRAGPGWSAALATLAIAGFVILARPSPSVVRAAAMCGLGLLALALGRPRAAVPALCVSIVLLVLVDPALAAAPGFALSVAATAGLLLVAPTWSAALKRRGVPGVAADALAVPAAAQVACSPLIAAFTGTVSLTAIPANLLAAPAVAPATVLGLLAAVTAPVAMPFATALAWLGQWPARWLVEVAERGARVPDGLLPWPGGAAGGWMLAALLVAGAFAARWRLARRLIAVVCAAVVVAVLPIRVAAPGWPPPGWAVVGCDVGQGDAVVLRAGTASAVVVDAGPDPAPVDACLRRLGVDHVPILFLSHLHLDHIGGLDGVLRGRSVGAIAIGPFREPAEGAAAVSREARRHGVRIVQLTAGKRLTAGAVGLRVLGPLRVLRGTRSDPNNNSLILRAQVRSVSVLLPGDAEHDAERALLGTREPLKVDVLKVPHHGSAWSEPAFLDAAAARVALVEVGVDNDYGHPAPAVLAHLTKRGARVLRTDLSGDLAVVTLADGTLSTAVRGRRE
ncbi:ComEC/Rec2 family competence protein [Cryptosporangium sp. NPDC048952]|uniref:ComEC/Rec2 family competence protein n=1 Tax=Cryptosporangium sp. NPDC048952 TaxID=3363961 RepID=UPI0037142656